MENLFNKKKSSLLFDIMYDINADDNKVSHHIIDLNNKYNLNFQEGLFQVVLIKIYFDEDPLTEEKRILKIINKDVCDKFIELMSNKLMDFDKLIATNRSYYLLNYNNENKEIVYRELQSLMEYAITKYEDEDGINEFKISIGLSEAIDNCNFKKIVEEAEKAVEQRLVIGSKNIIKYSDVPIWDYKEVDFLSDCEKNNLINLIKNKDKNEIVSFAKALEYKINNDTSEYSNGAKILSGCVNFIELFETEMVDQGFKKEGNNGLIQCFNKGKKSCSSVAEVIDMLATLIENELDIAGFGEIIFEE